MPKSPLLRVNRSPVRYGFCPAPKAIRYGVNRERGITIVQYKIAVWRVELITSVTFVNDRRSVILCVWKKALVVKVVIHISVFFLYWGAKWNKYDNSSNFMVVWEIFVPIISFLTELLMAVLPKKSPFSQAQYYHIHAHWKNVILVIWF